MRFDNDENMSIFGSDYQYSAISVDKLDNLEYTVITLIVDTTPSVSRFVDLIKDTLKKVVKGCKKNKQISENLLLRVVKFNTRIGVQEVHGFKELKMIDEDTDYNDIELDGFTNLFNSWDEEVKVLEDYLNNLTQSEFVNNCLIIGLTDGDDNLHDKTPEMVGNSIMSLKQKEVTESLLTILIGLTTDDNLSGYLKNFVDKAKIDAYINAKDMTTEGFAKLANFITDSISSTSDMRGTGSPSQVLDF